MPHTPGIYVLERRLCKAVIDFATVQTISEDDTIAKTS